MNPHLFNPGVFNFLTVQFSLKIISEANLKIDPQIPYYVILINFKVVLCVHYTKFQYHLHIIIKITEESNLVKLFDTYLGFYLPKSS